MIYNEIRTTSAIGRQRSLAQSQLTKSVGCLEGDLLGEDVGFVLGGEVGVTGESVGDFEGDAVGCEVGKRVGLSVAGGALDPKV